ncbi:hypothetical protein D3C78_1662530 [compost metagenome]
MLGAVHVGGAAGVVVEQGIQHRLRLLRGGGGIQIGLTAGGEGGEGREVGTPGGGQGHGADTLDEAAGGVGATVVGMR